jgi:hypothetical protein
VHKYISSATHQYTSVLSISLPSIHTVSPFSLNRSYSSLPPLLRSLLRVRADIYPFIGRCTKQNLSVPLLLCLFSSRSYLEGERTRRAEAYCSNGLTTASNALPSFLTSSSSSLHCCCCTRLSRCFDGEGGSGRGTGEGRSSGGPVSRERESAAELEEV